jgi:hypothetical protein
MIIPDTAGLRYIGLDGSRYEAVEFDRFIASWANGLQQTQRQLSDQPDRPGLVRSVFNLVAAIFRTVAGGLAGLIQGTINGL